jgi:hypothetical protein
VQWHGHAGNLSTAVRPPEHVIEKIAEPSFKNVDFGVRDRNARRPIVEDPPGLKIVFVRVAKSRPRGRHDKKIGWQFAEATWVAQG